MKLLITHKPNFIVGKLSYYVVVLTDNDKIVKKVKWSSTTVEDIIFSLHCGIHMYDARWAPPLIKNNPITEIRIEKISVYDGFGRNIYPFRKIQDYQRNKLRDKKYKHGLQIEHIIVRYKNNNPIEKKSYYVATKKLYGLKSPLKFTQDGIKLSENKYDLIGVNQVRYVVKKSNMIEYDMTIDSIKKVIFCDITGRRYDEEIIVRLPKKIFSYKKFYENSDYDIITKVEIKKARFSLFNNSIKSLMNPKPIDKFTFKLIA